MAEAANVLRDMFDFWRPLIRPYPPTDEDIVCHKAQIEYLRTVPQFAQRTRPWYEQTFNLTSGSEGSKMFATPGIRNGLIRSKCIPAKLPTPEEEADLAAWAKREEMRQQRAVRDWGKVLERAQVTVDARAWGQRYEPVVKLIHTARTGQNILEFGRVVHRTEPKVGASPDGIEESRPQGVEIKSVVSREITGEISFDYYVQMQMQMACCEIPWIEFVETKFSETELITGLPKNENATQGVMWIVATPDEPEFVEPGKGGAEPSRPLYYLYSPPFATAGEIEGWEDDVVVPEGWTIVAKRYWNLEVWAPQHVAWNKHWFDEVFLSVHAQFWLDVDHYREIGCDSIMPVPRKTKETAIAACPQWEED